MQPTMRFHPRLLFVATLICLSVLVASPAIAQAGLGAVRTDDDGDASRSFTFPASRAGVFEVVARGPGCFGEPYPIGLNASIAVSPNVVPEGVAVRVTAFLSGWCPNSTVVLSLSRLSFADAGTFSVAQANVTRTARILVVGDRDRDFDRDFDRFRDRDRDGDVIVNVQGNPPGDGTTVINNNNNNNNLMSGGGGSSASSSASSSSSAGGRGGGAFVPGGNGRGFLVRTGIDTLPLLLAGAGAILLGSVLLAAGRRRRHASSTS